MYKIVNGIEKIDKEDLVLATEDRTKGYVKIKMRQWNTTGSAQEIRRIGGNVDKLTQEGLGLVHVI
ncbi:hypothetical protein E2C01_073383 [Portunus trituberculatus]|uniref:Uncharacterized protein n=1 Tax=Portunus trituberculatus TaxID=210409 RepID=A0A5B7I0J4_PORTR|nr:hypothetical protein [Portunus trituberculatus]